MERGECVAVVVAPGAESQPRGLDLTGRTICRAGPDAAAAAAVAAVNCVFMLEMCVMLTEERRQAILERLDRDGKVVVAELSASLDVSLDTVRRDLQELAEAGRVRRVHGGALPPAIGSRPYAVRREQAPAAKAAIARATARPPARRPGDPARRGHDDPRGGAPPSSRPAGDGDHEQPADRGRAGRAPERRGGGARRHAREGCARARRGGDRRRAAMRCGPMC